MEEDVLQLSAGEGVYDRAVPPLPPPASFEEMGIRDALLRGVYAYGFERPSPVQKHTIAPLVQGRDMIAQSRSGTGKTASFSVGMLERMDPTMNECQGLIVVPTRELAANLGMLIRSLGGYMSTGGIRIHVIGFQGTFNRHRMKSVRVGGREGGDEVEYAQVVLGTPMRVREALYEGHLIPQFIRMVVFDELDEMNQRGYMDAIRDVRQMVPGSAQVAVFGCTMPDEDMALARELTHDPVLVNLSPRPLMLEGVAQYYIDCERDEYKYDTLCDLDTVLSPSARVIVLCNTRARAASLAKKMMENDHRVGLLRVDMSLDERDRVREQFAAGSLRYLILTNLANGSVIRALRPGSVVINFDLPRHKEDYIYRVGMLAREGRQQRNIAISFIEREEVKEIRELERFYGTSIEELPADVSSW